jgi:hypothetical protein
MGFTKWHLLENPEFISHTDGSSIVEGGVRKAGWAVPTMDNVIVTGTLPAVTSAEVAELVEKHLISTQTQGMLLVFTHDFGTQRIHDITGSSCEEWTRGESSTELSPVTWTSCHFENDSKWKNLYRPE